MSEPFENVKRNVHASGDECCVDSEDYDALLASYKQQAQKLEKLQEAIAKVAGSTWDDSAEKEIRKALEESRKA